MFSKPHWNFHFSIMVWKTVGLLENILSNLTDSTKDIPFISFLNRIIRQTTDSNRQMSRISIWIAFVQPTTVWQFCKKYARKPKIGSGPELKYTFTPYIFIKSLTFLHPYTLRFSGCFSAPFWTVNFRAVKNWAYFKKSTRENYWTSCVKLNKPKKTQKLWKNPFWTC